jgi:glycosyltransferase involved in cell wall biosynthesis
MFKKLKIAQLAPPWIEVPPKKYGGTELIVSYLSEELTKKGHDVTLFASGDSKTKSKLMSVFPKALYNVKKSWDDDFSSILHSLNCFSNKEFDIIHNHFNYYGIAFSELTKTPTLTTYHGNFNEVIEKKEAKYDLLKFSKNHPFVSISDSQRPKNLKLNFIGTVYNGIDVSQFKFNDTPKNYLAWLGRITPKKGILDAIKIAKKSKLNLKIAAKIDKNHLPDVEFYNKKVKPLIDGKKISFIGEIGGYREKSDFLGNALALLNPIEWDEPFGLNMTESMACGTPVIAYNRGSVKEIIKNNETGFIVKNIDEAVTVIKKIDKIKRKDCRYLVEEKFTKEIMVNNYEKLYYELINKKNV